MKRPRTAAIAWAMREAMPARRIACAALALLPSVTLGTYLATGLWGFVALVLLGILAALAMARPAPETVPRAADTPRARIIARLDTALGASGRTRDAGCVVIRLDDLSEIGATLEPRLCAELAGRLRERACAITRDGDAIELLDAEHLALTVTARAGLDIETMVQIASRVQMALHAPIEVGAADIRAGTTIGFSMVPAGTGWTGARLLEAAEDAMMDARLAGRGTIRAYDATVSARRTARHALQADVRDALADGQIIAWFQPQVCTSTGRLSGVEALARWHHPDRGWISPAEFLPALAATGLTTRLGDVMLRQALSALRAWDTIGHSVPRVSINLAEADLADPTLPRRVAWELDRADVAPHRLGVEVLETVIATTNDPTPARSLAALSGMGCIVDLDDFGTGCASITAIRAFPVGRIKIDRSFVSGIETDADKRRMLSAILTMAERLEVDTLAEGVETDGQAALLTQYGCGHLQGFWIARPMPAADIPGWIARRAETLPPATPLRRQSR